MINLQSELRKHLDSNETLLWTGKPKQGIVFKTSDLFLIPFSLMWGGFAIFWELTVLKTDATYFLKFWGIPFVLAGLYMIFGRFFFDSARRKNTVYGITQNRILIKSGVFKKSIKSIDIKSLNNIILDEKSNGTGTIVLGGENRINGYFRGTGWPRVNGRIAPALEMIKNARKAFRLITDLQRK